MKQVKTVPITLITGYLGSGKTTLINYILNNAGGRKMAVIVNDIGEVNIDEALIEKGGVVSGGEESLVSLSNGCICCTLKEDLIDQLSQIVKTKRFSHILIEASGICEPVPIAQTVTFLQNQFKANGMPEYCRLDAVVSVTDALRLADEFEGGAALKKGEVGEEDIENLIIQQIEFCDVIVLNKASEVSAAQLEKTERIIRTLQPGAKIIKSDHCRIDLNEILDTKLFDFDKAATSAGWFVEFESMDNEKEAHHHHHHGHEHHDHGHHGHEEHGHHHEHGEDCKCGCHKHHHPGENEEEGTAEEYGIGTYVYYRREPFDRLRFEDFINIDFGRSVIRTKGMVYFSDDKDMSFVYEQAGRQKYLTENGPFYATLPKKEIDELLKNEPRFRHDWDEKYGDRLIKLVFIGQHLDKKKIKETLDKV